MTTNIDEVSDFLEIARKKGLINDHTAKNRKTACSKLFSVLDEDQRTVEYVRDHFDVIKTRFQNLNKEIRGQTVDVYANRAKLAIEGFTHWTNDRAGWERDVAARSTGRTASTEKKARDDARTEKTKGNASSARPAADASQSSEEVRVVRFPLPSGFEVSVTLPRSNFTMADARRIAVGLACQTNDFDFASGASPMQALTMLESGATSPNG